jgi:predicted RNase H-like nuclease (RuvC/YqgF family)
MHDKSEVDELKAELETLKEKVSSTRHQTKSRVYRVPYVPKNNSIAKLNRHTGEAHFHKREIARRLRTKN